MHMFGEERLGFVRDLLGFQTPSVNVGEINDE